MASKNRTEWDGDRICAMRERMRANNVRAAAMTWTMRMFDKPFLAEGGSEKLGFGLDCRGSRERLEELEDALCIAWSRISECYKKRDTWIIT